MQIKFKKMLEHQNTICVPEHVEHVSEHEPEHIPVPDHIPEPEVLYDFPIPSDPLVFDNTNSAENSEDNDTSEFRITKSALRNIIYKKNWKLSEKLNSGESVDFNEKKVINRIIVSWLCEHTCGYPKCSNKKNLAATLCELYPQLKSKATGGHELWYQPSGQGHKASGLIHTRCANWRRGLCPTDKKFTKMDNAPKPLPYECQVIDLENKHWLQEFTTPLNIVDQKMQDSFLYRQNEVKCLTLSQFFSEWPRMKDAKYVSKFSIFF